MHGILLLLLVGISSVQSLLLSESAAHRYRNIKTNKETFKCYQCTNKDPGCYSSDASTLKQYEKTCEGSAKYPLLYCLVTIGYSKLVLTDPTEVRLYGLYDLPRQELGESVLRRTCANIEDFDHSTDANYAPKTNIWENLEFEAGYYRYACADTNLCNNIILTDPKMLAKASVYKAALEQTQKEEAKTRKTTQPPRGDTTAKHVSGGTKDADHDADSNNGSHTYDACITLGHILAVLVVWTGY